MDIELDKLRGLKVLYMYVPIYQFTCERNRVQESICKSRGGCSVVLFYLIYEIDK